jgi:glycosyltransferase involved in cell wall biosynthesis/predicted HAD superfamily hydrolase/tetratricopeptide (TPR) repeat protein
MWIDFDLHLKEFGSQLVLMSTTVPETPLPFFIIPIPFLLHDYARLFPHAVSRGGNTSVSDLAMSRSDSFRANHIYPPEAALKGISACRKLYATVLDTLQPGYVLAFDSTCPLAQILQSLAGESGVPVQYIERGLLPETLMIEARGIQAWSDLRTHWLAQDLPASAWDAAKYERIRSYYITRKPQKYAQADFGGGGVEIRRTLGLEGKKLIVFLGGGWEADGHAMQAGTYERYFFTGFPTTPATLMGLCRAVKKIPGTALVFKPHPLDSQSYEAARQQGAQIVTNVNVHALIEAADTVAVQYTTLQFEAALYDKPLLLLARSAWWGRKAAYEVEFPEDLPTKLDDALQCCDWAKHQANAHAFITWMMDQFLIGCSAAVPARRKLRDFAGFIARTSLDGRNLPPPEERVQRTAQALEQLCSTANPAAAGTPVPPGISPARPMPELPADLWRQDEALCRVAELIERGGRIRAISFDFFDTLVWRLTAKPTDVFYEVGRRLRRKNLLSAGVTEADFEVLRRQAEGQVRELTRTQTPSREDVSLSEIYRQLRTVVPDAAAGSEVERGTENDLCQLNPVMAGFLRHVRQCGCRVLIVSDIYLTADHLRGILRANHFDPAIFDVILTSCDAGLSKGTGNLFRYALKKLNLEAGQLLHIGDNVSSDVIGTRKAGVRCCHYRQMTAETTTLFDREEFLAGGEVMPFSFNPLRLLAARNFPKTAAESFWGQSGALLLGPLLARYATWACDQFMAAGVRQVGAFMREGEMLGQLLRNEAAAMGHKLEITPLYVNRKSTDLAAIGKLSSANLIDWLVHRQTLSVRTILENFGLRPEEVRKLPFSPNEKADSRERILKLAEYLFTPAISGLIEARSAEERGKVVDYFRPWLEAGTPVGLCDLGYNASAQLQLKRILDLEGLPAHLIGCYLTTCEVAARRRLDGLDIRHFIGAFGRPSLRYFAFLRSPTFVEQCITAPTGTTLGYRRSDDGTVKPVLDEIRFSPELLRHQHAFKEGVLLFQKLWLWTRSQKPELLNGISEDSQQVLAGLDRSSSTILARATAFPLPDELKHFGSLPLDDYYFAEGVKTICGPQEQELMRQGGYARLLTSPSVLWPQGVFNQNNTRAASEFFSYGKKMLLCDGNQDNNGEEPELTIIVLPGRDIGSLRECLNRLKPVVSRNPQSEVVLLVASDDRQTMTCAQEWEHEIKRFFILQAQPRQTVVQQLNHVMDVSVAPDVAILDSDAPLLPDWDTVMLKALHAHSKIGVVFPSLPPLPTNPAEKCPGILSGGFLVRRAALLDGLGFDEQFTLAAATWNLLLGMDDMGWQVVFCQAAVPKTPTHVASRIAEVETGLLKKHWPDFEHRIMKITRQNPHDDGAVNNKEVPIVWIGSFLDHGSLSQVNRELTAALRSVPGVQLQRVSNGAAASPGFETLAREISATASLAAAVTVRHAWPPDWSRPAHGKLAVIQPWEFGALPELWVKRAADVDEFWVPSEYVHRVYVESGVPAGKVVVVPNGVNAETFNPQATPMKLATPKKFKFLFVGGTILRKGPDLLLQAYLKNFTAADDVCLVIKDFGGQTVYAGQTFEAQIRAAQSQPNAPEILYLNAELPPDSLPGLYTACDCLVLPYRGEGFGLPALEAMACGLPVIVTAGGATDDFVRDDFAWRIPAERRIFGQEVSGMKLAGAGWLLEPDGAALGQFMRAAFANPAEAHRRGLLAALHAKQFCSWQNCAAIAAVRIRELAAKPSAVGSQAASANVSAKSARLEKTPVAPVKITLPPCALVGHLAGARELVCQKKFRAAWAATLAVLAQRPFHPEAGLLLAEIADIVGDGRAAKLCAEQVRQIAPGWKPAKKFLNRRLKGGAQPEWLKLPDEIQNPKSKISHRLSICLIVKNEEKFLGQCLKSVRDLATQIVVVDTGSTDRTVAIAKEHGAEVYSFAWCDDFSAARNVALEHVTGDWVLVLDADEELSAAGREKLPAAMNEPAVMAWRLPIVDVGHEAEGCSYVPRLFRNAPGLFFVGRVHEQVFSSLEVRRLEWGLENRIGDVPLIHYGYTAEMTRDRNKNARNLRLLERAIEELPEEPHLLMNLGLELARAGREAEALARYQEAYDCLSTKPAGEIVPELRETLLTQLCARLTAAKKFDAVLCVLTSPLAGMNGGLTASLHFSLGMAQLELAHFREAADQMRQCLAKRSQPGLAPINPEINTAAPHHCLALCLARLGDPAAAETAFQDGLKENGGGDAVRLDYARFLAEQNRPLDALGRLNEVVATNALHLEAWQLGGQIALSRPEFLEFARDWTREAMQHVAQDPRIIAQRAEALMLSEDTAGALALWQQVWNQAPQPVVMAALILCETVETPTTHMPDEGQGEVVVSRAFIRWYQKLLPVKAHRTITRLNEQTDKLSRALPEAARMLEAALAMAKEGAAGAK